MSSAWPASWACFIYSFLGKIQEINAFSQIFGRASWMDLIDGLLVVSIFAQI